MKVKVDEKLVVELSELQKKVIEYDVPKEIFESDMKRRVNYILIHKYERCLQRLMNEWLPIIKERMDAIPTHTDKLLEIIFSQKDYKDRSTKNNENKK